MSWLYTFGIHLFSFVLWLVSPFNEKARLLREGRKSVLEKLKELNGDSVVWVHCASLGEFEQGRPVIEALKSKHPGKKILLTFFSPSGYEVRKNYDQADVVCYLPADTPRNARWFVKLANPEVAIFIKYEFWPNFFRSLRQSSVPVYSASSIFRKDQIFFKWYGSWFRKTLSMVRKFYVQDKESGELLDSIGINAYKVVGDTRFDRVTSIVNSARDVLLAELFAAGSEFVIVAGSTWPADEDILIQYINQTPEHVKLIIAPHEVHESHVQQIVSKLSVSFFRYTEGEKADSSSAKVMIVDTIGLLSAIYRYGHVAYIGGGFGKGIHNTLEAATYGIPVLFGPRYHKFKEAKDLVARNGGFSIEGYKQFYPLVEKIRNDFQKRKEYGEAAGEYVSSMCGATAVIMKEVFS
ncbi:3-deoxy-D-manno-octulosonic acid transferase [Marinilabilia rubra]|uniref:3-deoxy-D-manno-octulosonic acid transferase n=1 Tax=Marinilabilia rubra TaxID=2162893 RepID=A0A2U2B4J0_9BACT|nr:glycosyltransferase N-terminal domain-containing protein [Marinilabilia rubra]PWD97979.1 3-deoxy-D-manno-octulosonic acid transferase [Marinilabilia rubra]